MRFWGWKDAAAPEPQAGPPAPPGPATARAIVARFQAAIASPAVLIGREYLDRSLLPEDPARIEAALLVVACEEAKAGRRDAILPLRELVRRLASAVSAEEAAQLRAFHARLPGGPEATLTGITAKIQLAIAGVDFVALGARQAADGRRMLGAFDAAVGPVGGGSLRPAIRR